MIPVPGNGRSLLQPVHVDDLADGIVAAWREEVAADRAYELSGAAPITFDDAIDAAAAACGKSIAKLHLPLAPVAWTLRGIEKLGITPRVKSEQVLRLAEDKAFPHDAAARDLGFRPRGFAEGVAAEARLLGLAP